MKAIKAIISVVIEQELINKLDQAKGNKSRSAFIREILNDYFS